MAGKAAPVADSLPFMNRHPDKPLLRNRLWMAALYVAVTLPLRRAERLVSAATSEKGFVAALAAQAGLFDRRRFRIVQAWRALRFATHAAAREMGRALGGGRLFAPFFRRPEAPRAT